MVLVEQLAGIISLGKLLENYSKGCFFRLNDKLMLSHLRSKLLVGVHVVVHYIDNWRLKEFLYSLCDNGTDIVLLLHF